MLTPSQNKALNQVLQHYIGGKIIDIRSNEDGDNMIFSTPLGVNGILSENSEGNWSIIINDEVVDVIEKEVFKILVNPGKKMILDEYLNNLNELIDRQDLKFRSKSLIKSIMKLLEGYILSPDFVPKKDIKVGIHYIVNFKGNKFINCLN